MAPRQVTVSSFLPLLALVLAYCAQYCVALTEQVATDFDSYIPRIGPPKTSHHVLALTPRFHRILGHNSENLEAGKAQTALFSVSETNVVGAVNPRNGAIVWRQALDDQVQGLYLDADLAAVVSGQDGERIDMFHALTGFSLWSRQLTAPGFGRLHGNGSAAASPGFDVTWLPMIDQPRYDVLALSNGDTLRRIDTQTGKDVWKFSRAEHGENSASSPSFQVMSSSSTHVHLLSLIPSTPTSFGLQHQVLSAQSGSLLATFELPGVSIDRMRGAMDVVVVPLNPSMSGGGTVPPEPQVLWRQDDGSIRAHALPLPPLDKPYSSSSSTKAGAPQVLLARHASDPFVEIRELHNMANEGFATGVRESGRGEILQMKREPVKGNPRKLVSFWEFEEESKDAVYSGCRDRRGAPYINRVYFSSAQHLLNFHVLWPHTNNFEGQVTGFSFRWDHDQHGDVIAAPFEVSPVSQYQLVTRAGLATRSGSMQLVQEDRHHWVNEEGLATTTHVAFVDLPRRARPSGSDISSQVALNLLQKEGPIGRVMRHLVGLKGVPQQIVSNLRSILRSGRDDKMIVPFPSSTSSIASSPQQHDLPPRPPRAGMPAREISPVSSSTPQTPQGNSKAERTKARNAAKAQEEKPIDSVAPRTLDRAETASYYSDKWGLRQLMISATAKGKLYAQDTGAKSQFVWEKSLVGFGDGEGSAIPTVTVKYLGVIRDLQPRAGQQLDPLMYVVAEVDDHKSDSVAGPVTQIWELRPLSGEFVEGAMTGKPLFVGRSLDIRKIKGHSVLAAVDESKTLHLWPKTSNSASVFAESLTTRPFYYSQVAESRNELTGFSVAVASANATPSTVVPLKEDWHWALPDGEQILSLHSSSVLTESSIAARGRELNDWFLRKMAKLLDPAMLVVVTFAEAERRLAIHLVDQSSGAILHSLSAPNAGQVDITRGAHVTFDANWLTLSYTVRNSGADVISGRILSLEYYDASASAERLLSNWYLRSITPRADVHSKDAKARGKAVAPRSKQVKAFAKSFILPSRFEGVGKGGTKVTETLHGAADVALLLLTGSEELVMVPRKLLDPRRPLPKSTKAKQSREEADPLLAPYDAMLPFDEKRVLTHSIQVLTSNGPGVQPNSQAGQARSGEGMIFSRRTKLESTSLVGIHGHGASDSFLTKVTTGGDFDLLSGTFNKAQLLLTTAGLGVAFLLTTPLVKSRTLRRRWT